MIKGTVHIKINVDNNEIAKKVTEVFQNIANNIDTKEIVALHKEIQLDKTFFKKVIKKINNPVIKNMFR